MNNFICRYGLEVIQIKNSFIPLLICCHRCKFVVFSMYAMDVIKLALALYLVGLNTQLV